MGRSIYGGTALNNQVKYHFAAVTFFRYYFNASRYYHPYDDSRSGLCTHEPPMGEKYFSWVDMWIFTKNIYPPMTLGWKILSTRHPYMNSWVFFIWVVGESHRGYISSLLLEILLCCKPIIFIVLGSSLTPWPGVGPSWGAFLTP